MPPPRLLLASLLLALSLAPGPAVAEVIKLTTLQWPPYSGFGLPRLGTMTAVVAGTAARAGDRLELQILPWKRAVRTGEGAPGYLGYYPVYWTAAREEHCHLSDVIGSSRLGLVEPAVAPVTWETVTDLAAFSLGTVEGYANTATFDRLAAKGALHVSEAADDVTNLRKVLAGRIDAAVIDSAVMDYLMATTPDLRDARAALQFNQTLLEERPLHVCFRRTPEGEAVRDRFNDALKKIDAAGTVAEVLDRVRLKTTDWLKDDTAKP